MRQRSFVGANIVVYDLEIKRPIEQCTRGWDSHDEMGISVGCAFDYRDMRFKVYMDDNMDQLVARLNVPGTMIVAFNHINFDNRLLRASGFDLKPDDQLLNYDMMVESKLGAGSAMDAYHKGFRLDDHLEALGLPMKTGNGALAPQLWSIGAIGQVVDYCLNDVQVERMLFEHIWHAGTLACAWKRTPYEVCAPQSILPD